MSQRSQEEIITPDRRSSIAAASPGAESPGKKLAAEREQPGKVICILGMHRSGTSCLTGSLQEAGLFLGKHSEWNRFNTKGNRENQDIVDLHGEILESNGCSWDKPAGSCQWSDEQLARLGDILSEYSDQARFGFKDPRTLLVLPGWKAVVQNLQFVGIFRHPEAVARSLKRRSRIYRGQAMELWYQYNLRLFKQYVRRPFPLLCFDDDGPQLTEKMNEMAVGLGLAPASDGNAFYSNKLRHYEAAENAALPRKVRVLYWLLRRISK